MVRPKTKESVGIAFPFYMLEAIDKDKGELTRSQYVVKCLRKKYPEPKIKKS